MPVITASVNDGEAMDVSTQESRPLELPPTTRAAPHGRDQADTDSKMTGSVELARSPVLVGYLWIDEGEQYWGRQRAG